MARVKVWCVNFQLSIVQSPAPMCGANTPAVPGTLPHPSRSGAGSFTGSIARRAHLHHSIAEDCARCPFDCTLGRSSKRPLTSDRNPSPTTALPVFNVASSFRNRHMRLEACATTLSTTRVGHLKYVASSGLWYDGL